MRRILLIIVATNAGLYVSDAYFYFDRSSLLAIKPLYWYALTLATTVAVALSTRLFREGRVPTPLLLWLSFYFAYVGLNFVHSSQSDVALQGLITAVEMGFLFLSFILLFQLEGAVDTARKIILLVAIGAALLNFYDFVFPTWSTVSGRAAGLYGNANLSATMLTISMVASIPVVPYRFRLPFCLLIGSAVLVTFSRGGWLQWIVALSGLLILGQVRSSWFTAIASFTGASVVLYVLLSGDGTELFSTLGLDQYLSHSVAERLNNPFSDNSASWRLAMALKAANVFFQHPLFGAGLAATREWDAPLGPHDMYVYLAAEGGLLGLALFFSLLVTTWRLAQGADRLIVLLFAISSLFSHNNLEKPELFFVLALAASCSQSERRTAHRRLRPPIQRACLQAESRQWDRGLSR